MDAERGQDVFTGVAALEFPPELDPESWVDHYGDILYRYALTRLRDPAQAEDAVQEALFAALKARSTFSGKSSVQTWLFSILKHKVVDMIRAECRENQLRVRADETRLEGFFRADGHYKAAPQVWKSNPRTDAEHREFWHQMRRCLDGAPKRLRQIFAMRELDGMEREEICKIMAISTSNYWVMLHRARLALRACLERHWGNPDRESGTC